jgi:hypothetical protein
MSFLPARSLRSIDCGLESTMQEVSCCHCPESDTI